jgi:hypothetical protein
MIGRFGTTVEINSTRVITKSSITLILLHRWELGTTVEKYSNTCNHKRAAHHFNPFIGGVGRTVEKYSNM